MRRNASLLLSREWLTALIPDLSWDQIEAALYELRRERRVEIKDARWYSVGKGQKALIGDHVRRVANAKRGGP